jgi:AcrR family transcriptional regulator
MGNRSTKEDPKSRIIDSAKKLFAELGYQETTVIDISKQAGLSEAALYECFQGKEDLLLTIPDLWVSDLLADVQEGRKTGEIKQEMNAYGARDIFVGTMDHIVTRWLLKDMSYSLLFARQ